MSLLQYVQFRQLTDLVLSNGPPNFVGELIEDFPVVVGGDVLPDTPKQTTVRVWNLHQWY